MTRLVFLATLFASTLLCRAESLLPPNARVAIIGDSITEQKLYSKYLEVYLLACAGRKDLHVFQFGWSGERAGGFAARLENDLSVFHPTVATTCYGMNDGAYVPYNPMIGADYEKYMRMVMDGLKKIGVQHVAVGSPGAVDTKYFTRIAPAVYNDNLAHLRDIARKLAGEYGQNFANVHDTMVEAMAKSKAGLGEAYDVCGTDGVHPGPNGHLLMAMAFLKGLGLDGKIGEITVDMKGTSTGTEGHVTTGSNGSAEVSSTTWPFCFDSASRTILPFCSFNEELNRFTLVVKNLSGTKAKVTWGSESKEFTAEQLSKGINLAAEFTKTPFDAAFAGFMNAVATKQAYETPMIKGMITNFRNFAADAQQDAEFAGALETLKKKMVAKQETLDAAVHEKLVPVKHQIKVEPIK